VFWGGRLFVFDVWGFVVGVRVETVIFVVFCFALAGSGCDR